MQHTKARAQQANTRHRKPYLALLLQLRLLCPAPPFLQPPVASPDAGDVQRHPLEPNGAQRSRPGRCGRRSAQPFPQKTAGSQANPWFTISGDVQHNAPGNHMMGIYLG